MARTRNQRRKYAQSGQCLRAKHTLEKEIERDGRFVAHLTQHGDLSVPSRRKAKEMRKASHAMDEQARFQSGFKGRISTTGPEMSHKTGYIGTIRTKDGTAFIREKCWLRRPSSI